MIFNRVQARSSLANMAESKSAIEKTGEEISPVNLKDGTTFDDLDETFIKRGVPNLSILVRSRRGSASSFPG